MVFRSAGRLILDLQKLTGNFRWMGISSAAVCVSSILGSMICVSFARVRHIFYLSFLPLYFFRCGAKADYALLNQWERLHSQLVSAHCFTPDSSRERAIIFALTFKMINLKRSISTGIGCLLSAPCVFGYLFLIDKEMFSAIVCDLPFTKKIYKNKAISSLGTVFAGGIYPLDVDIVLVIIFYLVHDVSVLDCLCKNLTSQQVISKTGIWI